MDVVKFAGVFVEYFLVEVVDETVGEYFGDDLSEDLYAALDLLSISIGTLYRGSEILLSAYLLT